MDPRHLTMAGLAALTLFAAGCGGGDDKSSSSTSGGLSRDDYVAQADKICKTANDKILSVRAPQNAKEVVAYVKVALPQIDTAVAKLKALDAGDDVKADAAKLIANLQKQREVIRRIGAAAKTRDVQALTNATADGAKLAETTQEQASDAGFQTCGVQQGSGTAG